MADKIKLDYRLAEEMIQTFRKGKEQLQQTLQEMQVAGKLDRRWRRPWGVAAMH